MRIYIHLTVYNAKLWVRLHASVCARFELLID